LDCCNREVITSYFVYSSATVLQYREHGLSVSVVCRFKPPLVRFVACCDSELFSPFRLRLMFVCGSVLLSSVLLVGVLKLEVFL